MHLEGVDGRTALARRRREILAQVIDDIGGDPTEAQLQIAKRAVSLSLWAESEEAKMAGGAELDITEFAAAANSARRLFETLGLGRRAVDISQPLDKFLAGHRSPEPVEDVPADDVAHDDEPLDDTAALQPAEEAAP
jgi:hypothetical protein